MNYFAGLDVGERRRHADASYVEGENGLISALSGADEFCFIAGGMGEAMKVVWLAVFVTITSTLAHAEDMADMISRYRREHGLSTVKTDPQLTAIAERWPPPASWITVWPGRLLRGCPACIRAWRLRT